MEVVLVPNTGGLLTGISLKGACWYSESRNYADIQKVQALLVVAALHWYLLEGHGLPVFNDKEIKFKKIINLR
jgi:hypothetical protein